MPGVEGIVVLDKTPFYAEMGGHLASSMGISFASTARPSRMARLTSWETRLSSYPSGQFRQGGAVPYRE